MQRIVFILGGARSGKSAYAMKEALSENGKKAFIATAEALDHEMNERIEKHKKERGSAWDTYEEPVKLAQLIKRIKGKYDVMIVDCLTLWMSNIMHIGCDINKEIKDLTSSFAISSPSLTYIISNELGLGLVPDSSLGRSYRDNLGLLNQRVANIATDVIFMVAGIPMKIKGGENL